jgi:multidrug efflux pump subunit AcrA (membrane-fusion protein)
MTILHRKFSTLRKAASASVLAFAMMMLGAMVMLDGCTKKADDAADTAPLVTVAHPSVGPIAPEITADAVLAPMAMAALSPRISSPIRSEYVQRGSHVRRGQVLLTLDDADLQGVAMDSKGALDAADASFAAMTKATIPQDVQRSELDVAQAKANLDVALQTAADRKKLFEEGALPGRDADIAAAAAVQAQATYDVAKKRMAAVLATTQMTDAKAAKGQLTAAKGRFMNAEAQVGYATLRSPIDGVVTDRPLFPGETAPAGTPVITVMDTSSLIAKLHITQADVQQLKLGDTADVTISGIAEPVKAIVSLISPALDPGSTTVEIWLKLANPNGRLKAGTAVHARIRGTAVKNAVIVPLSAVLPAQDGTNTVMVVGADSVGHLRPVKVGIRASEMAQILSGISAQDEVVTEGSYGLDDGTKVTPGDAKTNAEDKN